jgi:hypothetical protein
VDSAIIQDSYWFVDGDGENARMKAMCPICAKKAAKGWYWDKNLGYGDYDLFCNVCRNAIYLRRVIETDSQDK